MVRWFNIRLYYRFPNYKSIHKSLHTIHTLACMAHRAHLIHAHMHLVNTAGFAHNSYASIQGTQNTFESRAHASSLVLAHSSYLIAYIMTLNPFMLKSAFCLFFLFPDLCTLLYFSMVNTSHRSLKIVRDTPNCFLTNKRVYTSVEQEK